MNKYTIRATPLGGVGEVGALNCMVYETQDDAIIVDCGSQFPNDEIGVDLIINDYTYLRQIKDKLRAIVLTHGHEDHIGGVPYLRREFDLPIYASPFTMGLIRKKFKEHNLPNKNLFTFYPGDKVKPRGFEIETIHVNHSIIDAAALAIRTPLGSIVHVTDWKIDKTPISGEMTDLKKFSKIGSEGVLALFSDSTNIEKEGSTISEKQIAKQLGNICAKHRGRIFVTLFASNIHRVQALANVAKKLKRKLAFVGRSMHDNTLIARELGSLNLDGLDVIDIEQVSNYQDNEVMILVTGCQGEEMAVLSRLAFGQFKPCKIQEGDLILYSSKVIPGNERNVYNVINHLYRHGARVLYESNLEIHTSGHAHQNELKELIKRVRPKYFIPIHGDYRQLQKHSEFASTHGVKNSLVIENGQPLEWDDESLYQAEPVKTGRVFVEGIQDVSDILIRDRKKLSSTGIVMCVVMIDRDSGEILREPELISRGLVDEEINTDLLARAKEKVVDILNGFNSEVRTDIVEVQEELRINLRRFFNKELDKKPVVIPMVLEI